MKIGEAHQSQSSSLHSANTIGAPKRPAPIGVADRTGKKYYWRTVPWPALPIGGGGHRCANILAHRSPPAPIYWRSEALLRQYIGPGILSSCPNWDPPQPLNPQVSVSPLWFQGGDTFAGEVVGGGPNTRGQTLWYSKYHATSFKSLNIKNLKKRRTEHFSAPRLFSSRSPINWALQTGNGNTWK
jgi:hypothetical protein